MSWFSKKKKDPIKDLDLMLTDEEQRLLITDLELVEKKVTMEQRIVVAAAKEMAQQKRAVALPIIDLYIAAVEDALSTFAAFGIAPSGTVSLLEKLKAAKETK